MDTHVKPYKIYELDGIKIGVFGLGIELDGLVLKNMYKETVYQDPIETAQEMTKILKENEACDLIICLSHLGYKYSNPKRVSDITLA
jgi:5'-nucleotidase